jgi:hypothetical protein
MRPFLVTRSLLTALAIGLVVGGCSDSTPSSTGIDASSAPPVTVDGLYHATKLAVNEGSSTTDLIAGGAQVAIVLTSSGTTTGAMVIPAAYSESGTEETLSLDGTYTYDAGTGTVTFAHVADTFLRDMAWKAGGKELHGTLVNARSTLTATLQRGP